MINSRDNYPGIDIFRLLASALVVAIHAAPLASYNATIDSLIRATGRLAVPFFFMTSGFFLFANEHFSTKTLCSFVKRTAMLYAVATLIYLPINIYVGYFSAENLLHNITTDIIFNGTFYHLWYLPASIIGAVIAWCLIRRLKYPWALIITGILFVIGLLGDSYYGIARSIGGLESFYNCLFQFSDFSRNGFTFAPLFFVLGGYAASHKRERTLSKTTVLFVICYICTLLEAQLLQHLGYVRHDCMYIFQIPSIYLLFRILIHFRGDRHICMRTISMAVYIIHPMMILALRLLSRIPAMTFIVGNSIIYYLAVLLTSMGIAVILTQVQRFVYKSKEACRLNKAQPPV